VRTIVIGDIHGCFREFQALLQKVKFDRESDRLILLGDVIDRGPDSALVLQECQILKRDMGERFIQLLGNHEDMMLDAYASFDRSLWNYNGGSTTRKSFYKYNMEIPPVLAYLRTLPLYYETEHYICVHAAISCKGLEHTDRHTAIWDRKLAEDGTYSGKLVLYGHTPTEKVFYQTGDATCKAIIAGRTQPLPERGCIGLDTGCVARNKLTAMVIEENKPGGPVYQLRQVEYGKR